MKYEICYKCVQPYYGSHLCTDANKRIKTVKINFSLLGDLLGTIPTVVTIGEFYGGVVVILQSPIVYELLDEHPNIFLASTVCQSSDEYSEKEHLRDFKADFNFNYQDAWDFGKKHNLHMTQGFFKYIPDICDIPAKPLRPRLKDFSNLYVKSYDFVISPFSITLKEDGRWPREKWYELFKSMPEAKFCVLGMKQHIGEPLEEFPNVDLFLNYPLPMVCALIQKSKAVVSVVNGISHLCFALNHPNVLLHNQGPWGVNPHAIELKADTVPQIEVEKVIQICSNLV